jgi:hypothetical protein
MSWHEGWKRQERISNVSYCERDFDSRLFWQTKLRLLDCASRECSERSRPAAISSILV